MQSMSFYAYGDWKSSVVVLRSHLTEVSQTVRVRAAAGTIMAVEPHRSKSSSLGLAQRVCGHHASRRLYIIYGPQARPHWGCCANEWGALLEAIMFWAVPEFEMNDLDLGAGWLRANVPKMVGASSPRRRTAISTDLMLRQHHTSN